MKSFGVDLRFPAEVTCALCVVFFFFFVCSFSQVLSPLTQLQVGLTLSATEWCWMAPWLAGWSGTWLLRLQKPSDVLRLYYLKCDLYRRPQYAVVKNRHVQNFLHNFHLFFKSNLIRYFVCMFVLEWVYQVFLVYIHKFSLLVCELLTVTVIFSKKKKFCPFLGGKFCRNTI